MGYVKETVTGKFPPFSDLKNKEAVCILMDNLLKKENELQDKYHQLYMQTWLYEESEKIKQLEDEIKLSRKKRLRNLMKLAACDIR